jgi:hypothetical protein
VLPLPSSNLPPNARRRLREYQRKINALTDYEERVREAKRVWPLRNRRENRTFAAIRETLAGMCHGRRRCAYCEDSCADEVEHICPKDLYPEYVFVWENYLYACGICNVEKRNDFAVFPSADTQWADVKRQPQDLIVPPTAGEPVLINPRQEDPLTFLILDIRATFTFYPLGKSGSREFARARYTIDTLALNSRPVLIESRRDSYVGFRSRLVEYVEWRKENRSEHEIRELVSSLKNCPHQSVWEEMKRQHKLIPELEHLFQQAPEALHW